MILGRFKSWHSLNSGNCFCKKSFVSHMSRLYNIITNHLMRIFFYRRLSLIRMNKVRGDKDIWPITTSTLYRKLVYYWDRVKNHIFWNNCSKGVMYGVLLKSLFFHNSYWTREGLQLKTLCRNHIKGKKYVSSNSVFHILLIISALSLHSM